MMGMLANTRAAERLFKQGKGPDPRAMDFATGGDIGGGIVAGALRGWMQCVVLKERCSSRL